MDIRTIIIDDEEASVNLLRRLLSKFPQIDIVGTAGSATEALALITTKNPQLVFLDINMPGQNGFQLLNNFKAKTFEVVVASGFDYAMNAFKSNAVDYLLKPFTYEDLTVTIKKVETKLRHMDQGELSGEISKPENQLDKLGIPGRNGIVFLKISEIIRCEGLVNYTKIYLKSGETITCSKTLLEFDRQLTHCNFFRIHKSHLINLLYIEGFTRGASPHVIMSDRSQLQVSRRNRELLLRKLCVV
jgi:two-component system, LytTR family, response regulator